MKLKLVVLCCLALFSSLEAKTKMEDSQLTFFQHLGWSAEYLSGSKSEFKDPAFHGKKLSYSEGEISISYDDPYREERLSTMASLGYFTANLDWKENPYFSQKKFNSYKVKLGVAYPFDKSWTWQVGGGADVQVSPFSLADSSNYNLFLWGRYRYDDNRVFNIGVLSRLGTKDKQVYPILGINYKYNSQWYLGLIFPFKASITYLFTEDFGLELGGRSSQIRRRLKKDEVQSKGIFEYSSRSVELAAFYTFPMGIMIRGFVGAGLGTRMEIYNSKGQDKQLLKMKSPFFGGVSLESGF
jgi:hypothetical protein